MFHAPLARAQVSLGLNRETLDVVNRKAVLLQLKSHQGEKYTMKSNWNGYDPALQGKTGLMTRFGPHDPGEARAPACPRPPAPPRPRALTAASAIAGRCQGRGCGHAEFPRRRVVRGLPDGVHGDVGRPRGALLA